jgi:hypothetical protein
MEKINKKKNKGGGGPFIYLSGNLLLYNKYIYYIFLDLFIIYVNNQL